MANYCFVVPILPGGEEMMRHWNRVDIVHNAQHDAEFAEAGITREQVWIERTPMGDMAVVSFEVDSVERAFGTFATSSGPWAVGFRDLLLHAHGIDVTKPTAPNEQIVDWHA